MDENDPRNLLNSISVKNLVVGFNGIVKKVAKAAKNDFDSFVKIDFIEYKEIRGKSSTNLLH